ncbi:MAG: type II secretion system protein [bacterium]|nr:type II secretion system protein [bacterium]
MNKKGFTLVELLVVIAIISVLSLLVVPSIININKNVDERLYSEKVEYIVSAAELYASNNPDIFQGSDVVEIPVYTLLEAGYLKPDKNVSNCEYKDGCIINPINKEILNDETVTVTKKSVGIVGEFKENDGTVVNSSSDTLVNKVCDGFDNELFTGKYGTGESENCHCVGRNTNGSAVKLVDESGNEVTSCIIVSNKDSGEVNNWLKYGSSEANWRVIGLYKVDGTVSAKMITSGVVK